MRKILVLLFALIAQTLPAQTYYNMWRGSGQSGQPEWIANSAMSYGFTGIQFTTADIYRGHIAGNGQWFIMNPDESITSSQYVNTLKNNMANVANCALGTQGGIAANKFLLTDFEISSNVDAYLSFGRNHHVTFDNQVAQWLRINSYGGIACWGNGLANDNDNPNLLLTGTEMKTFLDGIYASLKKSNNSLWFGSTSNAGFEIGTNGTTALYIGNGQNIFLGFNRNTAAEIRDPLKLQYRLFVDKGILSEDYAIAPKSAWADYVFSKEYSLRSLSELETYIDKNRHLPDVPSAEDVSKNGYSQHELNTVLLQKIEELTLYIIMQQKEIEELKHKMINL
ncbi:MAG: hypothetical protein Q4B16_07095 [Bacteroidia bacterium]|nr:hypothetical protein [Bacteroidia bacterium]